MAVEQLHEKSRMRHRPSFRPLGRTQRCDPPPGFVARSGKWVRLAEAPMAEKQKYRKQPHAK
jgi:hypothetical protein